MTTPCDQLLALLRTPERAERLSESDWDGVVRIARRCDVLATLGDRLQSAGVAGRVPRAAWWHMEGELHAAAAHHRNVRWEVRRIAEALGSSGLSFALLKGSAYVLAELAAGRGRVFHDVDILVPRADLARAEAALEIHGWVTLHREGYDQRYYRLWMHEIPPMQHVRRGTTLDVHHNLLPLTAPLHPDGDRLWAATVPLPGWSGVRIPAETDLVLHSAAHLFFDGAFEMGLRDLLDLDALLREFGRRNAFWAALTRRAEQQDLMRPLADGLYWSRRMLGTPLPARALRFAEVHRRRGFRGRLVERLFTQGLRPNHPLCAGAGAALSRWLLYVRSHTLRMPLHMIVPHLLRKALRTPRDAAAA